MTSDGLVDRPLGHELSARGCKVPVTGSRHVNHTIEDRFARIDFFQVILLLSYLCLLVFKIASFSQVVVQVARSMLSSFFLVFSCFFFLLEFILPVIVKKYEVFSNFP